MGDWASESREGRARTERNGGEEKIPCGRKTKCHVIIAVGVPSGRKDETEREREREKESNLSGRLLLLLLLVLATGR